MAYFTLYVLVNKNERNIEVNVVYLVSPMLTINEISVLNENTSSEFTI